MPAADKLTYGGVPLLFDDGGVAQDFLDRYQPLEELALHGPNVSTLGSRTSSYGQTKQIGLPLPNYPPYPRPRVNELYWPTGAARWAIGYFLIDSAGLAQLPSSTEQTARLLKANDGTTSMQWSLFELTRIPISNPTGGNNLWLLVLVDERYWWQFVSAGTPTVTSWTGILSALAGRIPATITQDTVPAALLIPDPDEMGRNYDNAALLIDAVAHSCGQRLVRQFDGTVRSENASGAEAQYQLNAVGPYRLAAGGDMPARVPETLEIVFPKLVGCCWNGEYHSITKDASDFIAASLKTAPFTKTIHDTAWANGDSTPTNASTLDALAERVAEDYYDWLKRRYDWTFIGLQTWELTGYDDAVTISFGQMLEETPQAISTLDDDQVHTVLERQWQPRYFTRVRSLPLNFGVDQLCHQDDDLDLPERAPGCEIRLGVTEAEISQGSSGTINEYRINESNAQVYTGRTFAAWDALENVGGTVPASVKVVCAWICDRYVIIQAMCQVTDTEPATP